MRYVKKEIMVVSNMAEEVSDLRYLLSSEYKGVVYINNEEEGIAQFQKIRSSLLILAFSSVEKSEQFYLRLHRNYRDIYKRAHQTLLLCTNRESAKAYKLCLNGTFDDYAVDRPLYDANKILMAIYHGLKRRETDKQMMLLYQRLKQYNGDLGPLDESLKRMIDHSSDKQSGMLKRFEVYMDSLQLQLEDLKQHLLETCSGSEGFAQQLNELFKVYQKRYLTPGKLSMIREMGALQQMLGDTVQQFNDYVEGIKEVNSEGSNTILLVDDDDFYRDHLTGILKDAGYNVIEAESGEGALEALASNTPVLILLDYEMPGMNGIETVKKIKENSAWQKIPVVMLTGFSQSVIVKESFRAGASGYIIKKSLDHNNLVSRVNKYVIDTR